jgi:hypothetical protein
MPHTGPNGGGDSKVDSETYPVADALAEVWYSGIGREAATERWASAISAKRDWRPKVQADVAKIVTTDRAYTVVFFFSSRYIRDKERAEVEEALARKHQVKVRIFDRTWLLDKVFINKHEALAIETLHIDVPLHPQARLGPQDTERLVEFEEKQAHIQEAVSQQHYSIVLVDDCLEAAILGRQLEKPVDEVDGLFLRAGRLAAKYGTEQQRITCLYQRAWTACWWHEDLLLFEEPYEKFEQLVAGSRNIFDIERLHNLWSIYQSATYHKEITAQPAVIAGKTDLLLAELTRLSQEVDRPNTALQARSHLLLVTLIQLLSARDLPGVAGVLRSMREVVQQSAGLVGFGLDPLVETVTSVGKFLVDMPAYDTLFDELVAVRSTRQSEVAGATMLVERGGQQYDGGKPAEAIKSFGKALSKLYKYESRREAVKALAACGIAYDKINLHWAARNSVLMSASIATDGSAVHHALEKRFRQMQEHEQQEFGPAEELVKSFEVQLWRDRAELEPATYERRRKAGRRFLLQFHAYYQPQWLSAAVVEHRVERAILPSGILLTGAMDRLDQVPRDTDRLSPDMLTGAVDRLDPDPVEGHHLIDYKTGNPKYVKECLGYSCYASRMALG